MSYRLAIVGATGAVGAIVLEQIEKRKLKYSQLKLLASARSVGKIISVNGQQHSVELLCPTAFDNVDIVIGTTPDEVAAEFVPWAVERGAIVVDESGYHRMLNHVPLVIPEVNPHALSQHRGIIASPNCSTTQMVVALKPLHDAARVKRVVVSTYQATSGAGTAGNDSLSQNVQDWVRNHPMQPGVFKYPIGFNLIPQIGSHKDEGYTSEEMKMVRETQKILGDDSILVCPTCVRVPVDNCHSESILVETEQPLTVSMAKELWSKAPGIKLIDDLPAGEYPMPSNCNRKDEVFIGRIRRDISSPNGIAFWCVSDNLRKGAATNAVQIAELLMTGKYATCGS